ncbi:hypothetical protein Xoosp14_250 [Xanthomonas phage Xoo-sp14]|nr:hypothetical protein Xoosp14_250 [Xanthomonas phage Xoo-sp14]
MDMNPTDRNALIITAVIGAGLVGLAYMRKRKQDKAMAAFHEEIQNIGKVKLSPAAQFAATGGVTSLAKFRAEKLKGKKTATKKAVKKAPTRAAR